MSHSLIPYLTDILVKRHLSHYQGKTLGIDGDSWIKQISKLFKCPTSNQSLEAITKELAKRVRMIHSYFITIVFVLSEDPSSFGYLFQRTHNQSWVYLLMERATRIARNERALVVRSPHEAISQLAYFSKTKYVDCAMTNDQAILAFGAKSVLLNYDFEEDKGYELFYSDIPKSKYFHQFDHNMFLTVWIVTCYQFVPRTPNLGVKTAIKLLRLYPQIQGMFQKTHCQQACEICEHPQNIRFRQSYVDDFVVAFVKFRFRLVYCYESKRCNRLNRVSIRDVLNEQGGRKRDINEWDGELLNSYMKRLLNKREEYSFCEEKKITQRQRKEESAQRVPIAEMANDKHDD